MAKTEKGFEATAGQAAGSDDVRTAYEVHTLAQVLWRHLLGPTVWAAEMAGGQVPVPWYAGTWPGMGLGPWAGGPTPAGPFVAPFATGGAGGWVM